MAAIYIYFLNSTARKFNQNIRIYLFNNNITCFILQNHVSFQPGKHMHFRNLKNAEENIRFSFTLTK